MDKKKLIYDFIHTQQLAVIATVNKENKPESAVLEFGETEELELIFDTFNQSRKFLNIKDNSFVSFVIGWDENITVQYEGKAEMLSKEEAGKYKSAYFKKNPEAQRWESREGIVFFKVSPIWIRYSNLNKDPWEIFELVF